METGQNDINKKALRILFAGGGTGGHVYPALAIARAIKALSHSTVIEFAGTTNHLEWQVVPAAGFKIHPITVSPFHRKITLRNLLFPYRLIRGIFQSRALIKSFQPDVVVGTGGYVSGPVLWAAAKAGIPTVVQEQNAFAGKTNKMLASKAAQIHIAFEDARRWFPTEKCRLSGNPTRRELLHSTREAARQYFDIAEEKKVVFVFGGSLGSAAINRVLAEKHEEILADPTVFLIWQTGSRYYDRYRHEIGNKAGIKLLKYVDRMDHAYAAADIVVCRAGAISCSELELTGSPAILIPSPNVAEDHQTFNARSLADNGAAWLLPESEMEEKIVQKINELLNDATQLIGMSRNLRARAKPDAAESIAADILELAGFSPPLHGSLDAVDNGEADR